jgi:hypothetical protein
MREEWIMERKEKEIKDDNKNKWVKFTIPDEDYYVVEFPSYKPPDGPVCPDEKRQFTFGRDVINVKVYKKEEDCNISFPTTYEPPITLRVYYVKSDEDFAEEGKPVLAYWTGFCWVIFSQDEHELIEVELDDPRWKGYNEVQISSWSDPVIAWGQ